VRPGDTITGLVEIVEVRDDKPMCRLRNEVVRGDGVTVVEGSALTYTVPLPRRLDGGSGDGPSSGG
jgi:acyl dehydratase